MNGRGIKITHTKEMDLAEHLGGLFPGHCFQVLGRFRAPAGFDIQWDGTLPVEPVREAATVWINRTFEVDYLAADWGEPYEGASRFEGGES